MTQEQKVEAIAFEDYMRGKKESENPFKNTKWESVWLNAYKMEKEYWENRFNKNPVKRL